jgi:hypothetical protein
MENAVMSATNNIAKKVNKTPNKITERAGRARALQTHAIEPESNAHVIKASGQMRKLNVRPDGLDFRDKMYIPTLIEVSVVRKLEAYRKLKIPVLVLAWRLSFIIYCAHADKLKIPIVLVLICCMTWHVVTMSGLALIMKDQVAAER